MRSASNQNVGAQVSALGTSIGLAQSAKSSSQALTGGKAIRVAVRNGFIAINEANKKLYACKWGHCTKAGRALRKAAQRSLKVLQGMPPETKTVARGLQCRDHLASVLVRGRERRRSRRRRR
jgi:hypothetical protein